MRIVVQAPKGWEWLIADSLILYSEKYQTTLSVDNSDSCESTQHALVNEAKQVTKRHNAIDYNSKL